MVAMIYIIYMKKILYIMVLINLLASCSAPGIKFRPAHRGVDPELQALNDEFIDLSGRNGIFYDAKVTVGFVNSISKEKAIGQCTTMMWFREVDILKGYWERASDLSKKTLLFHELGHGYCGRQHNNKLRADGCPESLMNSVAVPDECVKVYYSEYIKELFESCDPY